MKEIEGDLIKLAKEGEFDVIVHGANCMQVMGSGIAKTIRQVFPEAWYADLATTKGDLGKMGTLSIAHINDLTIVNAYTQFNYLGRKTGKMDLNYVALRMCMKQIKKKFTGKRIGMPLIGAGLAGGDWNVIKTILEEELFDEDLTIVKLKK
jgi:O-acetyl-ADP-ribose deacetylase (regulator of RNase III)